MEKNKSIHMKAVDYTSNQWREIYPFQIYIPMHK